MFRTSPMVQELLLHSNKTSLPTANSAVLEFLDATTKTWHFFGVLTLKFSLERFEPKILDHFFSNDVLSLKKKNHSKLKGANFFGRFLKWINGNHPGSYVVKLHLRFQGHHLCIFRFFILFQDILSMVDYIRARHFSNLSMSRNPTKGTCKLILGISPQSSRGGVREF